MRLILRQELRTRLRDLKFWISVLTTPVSIVLLAYSYLSSTSRSERDDHPLQIYVKGDIEELKSTLTHPPGFFFVFPPSHAVPTLSNLQKNEALLWLTERSDSHFTFNLYTHKPLPKDQQQDLQRALLQAIQYKRMQDLNISPQQWAYLNPYPELKIYLLGEEAESPRELQTISFIGLALSLLIYFTLIGVGAETFESTAKEKRARLSEYLATILPSNEVLKAKFLSGLILGGIRMIPVLLSLLVGVLWMQRYFPALTLTLSSIPWGWIILYLLVGTLSYALIYAYMGALYGSSSEPSAVLRGLNWLPTAALIINSFTWASGLDMDPVEWADNLGEESIGWLKGLRSMPLEWIKRNVLSYLAGTAPIIMPARLLTESVPLWQKLTSLGVLGLNLLGHWMYLELRKSEAFLQPTERR